MTALALTVRQPFGAAVFWASPVKDIENRSWRPPVPPPFRMFIHAAARDYPGWQATPMAAVLAAIPAELRELRGVLLGRVTVTAITRDADSPWALPGCWHWELTDPRPLPPGLAVRGRLSLWNLERAIRALYEGELP